MAAILSIFFLVDVGLPQRIGEIQPEFVDSRLQRDVVLKTVFWLRHHVVIGGGLTKRVEWTFVRHRRKKMPRPGLNDASFEVAIGAPAVSPFIQVWRSSVTRGDTDVVRIAEQRYRSVPYLVLRARTHLRRKRCRGDEGERRIDSAGFKREFSHPNE